MRIVRDEEGTTYVLVEESADSSLVRDPATGAERRLPSGDLEAVDGEAPLVAAARALPDPGEAPLDSIADPRAVGLLVHLNANGPQPVTALLDIDGLCESDLHGATAELRAAGLIEEATIDGIRGYRASEAAERALEKLRN